MHEFLSLSLLLYLTPYSALTTNSKCPSIEYFDVLNMNCLCIWVFRTHFWCLVFSRWRFFFFKIMHVVILHSSSVVIYSLSTNANANRHIHTHTQTHWQKLSVGFCKCVDYTHTLFVCLLHMPFNAFDAIYGTIYKLII